MSEDDSVSVKWDHHQPVLLQAIKEIYAKEIFADVRLECDGHEHWVHKFILSACSEFFQDVLVDVPHRGSITVSSYVQHKQLVSLLDFMYLGEVIVPQEELAQLVNAAEVLMVRGFAVPCDEADDDDDDNIDNDFQDKDIFNKIADKLPNQPSESFDGNFLDEGGSSYIYDQKLNFKRRIGEDEEVNKDYKERRMLGQEQEAFQGIVIKEEPVDPDYGERLHYSGNQFNRYQQAVPMHGSQLGGGNASITMRQADVNGGNPNADISNLLNVLIDSNPDNKKMQGLNAAKKKVNDMQNQGPLNSSQMCMETEVGFVCPQCRKTFHWRSNLTKHMRTHTGEKPYSCSTCPYRTSYSEALKRHIRIHTGEKPYKCEMCDYRGKDYGSLKSHLKKHAPHQFVPHITSQISPQMTPQITPQLIPQLTPQITPQIAPPQLAPPQVGLEQQLS